MLLKALYLHDNVRIILCSNHAQSELSETLVLLRALYLQDNVRIILCNNHAQSELSETLMLERCIFMTMSALYYVTIMYSLNSVKHSCY